MQENEEKILELLKDLEGKLKIEIKNPNLFLEALTHSSYLNENKD